MYLEPFCFAYCSSFLSAAFQTQSFQPLIFLFPQLFALFSCSLRLPVIYKQPNCHSQECSTKFCYQGHVLHVGDALHQMSNVPTLLKMLLALKGASQFSKVVPSYHLARVQLPHYRFPDFYGFHCANY